MTLSISALSLLSSLVMATQFLSRPKGAEWKLVFVGDNYVENSLPNVTQSMLDFLVENPSCQVEFEGSVEANAFFKLTVESV